MNSIAVWWNLKDGASDTPTIYLDTNIWLTKNEANNYIEIGLKITNSKAIKDICFYFPFLFDECDFKDKIKKLVESTSLTNALFNDNMQIERHSGKFHKVGYPITDEANPNFYYCELNENTDMSIVRCTDNDNNSGSKLTIKLDNVTYPSPDTIYLRFRINKLDNIFRSINENNFITDGFFKKIGFVEFNINNIRKLPADIADKVSSKIKIKKINLFLMTDNFSNFLFVSKPLKGSRILENHIWDDYLNKSKKDINTDKIIAYHWQENDISREFNIFTKYTYTNHSKFVFCGMIFLILALGAIGSIVGNYATTRFFHNFCITNTTQEGVNDKLSMPKNKAN